MKAVVLNVQGDIERDCREDEVGVIVLQGPNVTPGYTDSQRNRELWVIDRLGEEWLNTGDLARQDSDGYFWMVGRAKELIIRGGHNIDPSTSEQLRQKLW